MPFAPALLLTLAVLAQGLDYWQDYWQIGGFRNHTCLANATAPSERRNVTVGGVSQPLKIGTVTSAASELQSWIIRIIFEDMLGIKVEQFAYTWTTTALEASYDCHSHITLALWGSNSLDRVDRDLKRDHEEKVPIELGNIGYLVYDAFYVKEEIVNAAMQEDHLPLDFYLSYGHPHIDITRFFDRPENISRHNMEPCWAWQLWYRLDIYEHITGDMGSRCLDNNWWYSPACRWDTSRCIPAIVEASGISELMQYAYWHGIPVAMGFVNDMATYKQRVEDHRVIFYSWFPSPQFLHLNTSRIIFPFHDERLWSQGVYKTDCPAVSSRKVACRQLEFRDSEGTAQLAATVGNMRLNPQDIIDLLTANLNQSPEAAACQWLKARTVPWDNWIASGTACLDGQGLVSENGSFVDARGLGASGCLWCPPGRKSVRLVDSEGTTYRCESCVAGRFQELMGAASCEPCASGEFAPRNGTSTCELCPVGRYAPERGQVQCNACPAGFVTALRGVVSFADCICPEGLYRDARDRDTCRPCRARMTCPEGSDELAYASQSAPQPVIVPLLQPGYWSSAEAPFDVLSCDNTFRCSGGLPGSACAAHLEQQACAHCEDGYYWAGKGCQTCADSKAMTILAPALVLVGAILGVRLLYVLNASGYDSWKSWSQGLSSAIFLTINHYQTANAIRQTSLQLPFHVWNIFETFAFVNEGMDLLVNDCSGFRSLMRKLVMQSVAPALVFLVYIGVWGASKLLSLRCPSAEMDVDRTMEGFFSLMLTFFGGIAEGAFTIFKCGTNPNGSLTLLKDRSITCFQEEWNGMVAIGILSVLCWCVGFGLLFARAIYLAPYNFHKEEMRKRWRFLFIRYRPDVHWWGLVFVAKGVLLSMGPAVLTSGIAQLFWIEFVLLAYVNLTSMFRPWRHSLNCIFDVWMHVCLFLTCSVTIWFAREGSQDPDRGDSIGQGILTASLCGVALPVPPFVAIMVYRQRSAAERRRREKDLKRTMACMGKPDDSECMDFLQGLHETDLRVMMDFMRLVETELAHRRSRGGYSISICSAAAKVEDQVSICSAAAEVEDQEAMAFPELAEQAQACFSAEGADSATPFANAKRMSAKGADSATPFAIAKRMSKAQFNEL